MSTYSDVPMVFEPFFKMAVSREQQILWAVMFAQIEQDNLPAPTPAPYAGPEFCDLCSAETACTRVGDLDLCPACDAERLLIFTVHETGTDQEPAAFDLNGRAMVESYIRSLVANPRRAFRISRETFYDLEDTKAECVSLKDAAGSITLFIQPMINHEPHCSFCRRHSAN